MFAIYSLYILCYKLFEGVKILGQNFAAMCYVAAAVRAGQLPDKDRTDAEIQALFTASCQTLPPCPKCNRTMVSSGGQFHCTVHGDPTLLPNEEVSDEAWMGAERNRL
ncbi:hypothetical protein A3C60_01185 [Candidatus Nomurabacteria bacterium RIFCSPHIGHO2_02_FULL_37_45]|uniref:Uncharacterized protein n=1 Tax=Candidatus Nomurabacteria bacterium RIFCSPHIGHO2_12_FULL_37_29 TaxID=1801759 RepID=A0A1F6WBP1_9BACT|nr:MAG: hypothetical protein A2727_01850 [Candidatus Nomurabacteria bacterium RIFCSPHIGHO2_01_FULL_37_110]OGI71252.1 MAG: hypothetical protein A3C60_01185 [Candidatus Nomurabacteria bacterium RIFCSPHIGHO2_02_FULL_37_45]OGI79309.1 MAG: hypothetical protein A3F19_02310 [Candidatus Nomurabacteria bacterium RIFCSPHIGHO2_12_FULL_37_29]OGI84858.1 MAG: hypothetical protein A3A92_00820 [Candidatus Nomurabacteria bacterium RIFCSPLOWO2_01_FULL_37_49]